MVKKTVLFAAAALLASACGEKNENVSHGSMTLHFNNTFGDRTIVLGDATSAAATENTSAKGQVHRFSELKYVISNIRLVKADGGELPYNTNDLDKGAAVINQAKPQTLAFALADIPAGEYKELKFGLGVQWELNQLDEARFPRFYAEAGANDTKMMWEWGTGYRFAKIEGFYGADKAELSIHTGSTLDGTRDKEETYTQGVDAYRDIALAFPKAATVGPNAPRITIRADFDKLLSGAAETIELGRGNARPSIHTAVEMVKFVDNLGGMFSVESVEN